MLLINNYCTYHVALNVREHLEQKWAALHFLVQIRKIVVASSTLFTLCHHAQIIGVKKQKIGLAETSLTWGEISGRRVELKEHLFLRL
jgi:hypothetical protein